VQFDPATSEDSSVAPVREGLPKAFRMRHGRHYVEQLMGDAPLRTVREIAVSDFHAVPESDLDLSTLQQSIGSVGVLQPLLVTVDAGRYHVIAGRNRLRAAMALGLLTVPCLVHDVARDGLDSLRQAVKRRAVATGMPDVRSKETVRPNTPVAASDVGRTSPSTIAVAGDDRLRLAVLADLMHVELQRGETLGAAADALDNHSSISRDIVAAGTLVEPLLARIKPEARLRNASVAVTISDADYRIPADKRLLATALECMAHGMLMLCKGDSSELRITVEGTWIRPALIVEISQDATTIDVNAGRRFFDRDFRDHPAGHAGALMAACVERVARQHGGRAGVCAIAPSGCALTLVVPRPMHV
jgi:ParB/Sulfiredoxin domain